MLAFMLMITRCMVTYEWRNSSGAQTLLESGKDSSKCSIPCTPNHNESMSEVFTSGDYLHLKFMASCLRKTKFRVDDQRSLFCPGCLNLTDMFYIFAQTLKRYDSLIEDLKAKVKYKIFPMSQSCSEYSITTTFLTSISKAIHD